MEWLTGVQTKTVLGWVVAIRLCTEGPRASSAARHITANGLTRITKSKRHPRITEAVSYKSAWNDKVWPLSGFPLGFGVWAYALVQFKEMKTTSRKAHSTLEAIAYLKSEAIGHRLIPTRRGGDSGRVAGLLVEVCQIQSSADAFSAIRRDGSVLWRAKCVSSKIRGGATSSCSDSGCLQDARALSDFPTPFIVNVCFSQTMCSLRWCAGGMRRVVGTAAPPLGSLPATFRLLGFRV